MVEERRRYRGKLEPPPPPRRRTVPLQATRGRVTTRASVATAVPSEAEERRRSRPRPVRPARPSIEVGGLVQRLALAARLAAIIDHSDVEALLLKIAASVASSVSVPVLPCSISTVMLVRGRRREEPAVQAHAVGGREPDAGCTGGQLPRTAG